MISPQLATLMMLVFATHSVQNTPTLAQVDDVHNQSILYDIYVQDSSSSNNSRSSKLLEDYPDCGMRNNDTFNFPNTTENLGGQATADWSAECLWDCNWQENPYMGKIYPVNLGEGVTLKLSIFISMPKVPVDLRCLHNCTDIKPPTYIDFIRGEAWDCSVYSVNFPTCYMVFTQYAVAIANGTNLGTFVSKTYFHLAVEACYLALVEPSLYPQNCDQLRVNLRVFNPYLPSPPYLFGSLIPSQAQKIRNSNNITLDREGLNRLQGPATQEVVAIYGAGSGQVPLKNRHPWLCSLRTPGYRGLHRCGVTLLSGPPRPTIFVSAAHCNYLCKDQRGRSVELCCCREAGSEFSCAGTDFCGNSSSLQPALPEVRFQSVLPTGRNFGRKMQKWPHKNLSGRNNLRPKFWQIIIKMAEK
jgi:hypothetical protein